MTTPRSSIPDVGLIGQRFGRLVVQVKAESSKHGAILFQCVCDCGKEKVIHKCSLLAGTTRSCGCLARELSAQRHYKHGYGKRNSEGRRPRTWEIWIAMRDRCNAPNHWQRKDYGGRGIKVCPEWDDFSVFLRDMGECPPKLTIERLDVNGNYEKSNCVWATMSQQRLNQRRMFSPTCLHGHPRTLENTGTSRMGKHFCIPCGREHDIRKEIERKTHNAAK